MVGKRILTFIFTILSSVLITDLTWSSPDKGTFTLEVSNDLLLSLVAKNAPLSDIVDQISEKTKVEISLIGRIESKVSAHIVDERVETFIERLAENWSAEYSGTHPQSNKLTKIYILPKENLHQIILRNVSSDSIDNNLQYNDFSAHGFLQTYKNRIATERGGGTPLEYIANELIVKFRANVHKNRIKAVLRQVGAKIIQKNEQLSIYRLRFSQNVDLFSVVREIRKTGIIQKLEPNFVIRASAVTLNDPLTVNQWSLSKINAYRGWEFTTGDPWSVVAVVDTGVADDHPDLQGRVLDGYSVFDDLPTNDEHGHGTAMAGIIGANANNDTGIAGVNWHCMLLPVKVLDRDGIGSYFDLIEGIIAASEMEADIINLSLGGYGESEFLKEAIDLALSKNIVVVAAGGNAQTNETIYPAGLPGVIGVSATNSDDEVWEDSNYGHYIDIAAPGVGVISSWMPNLYMFGTGTSYSAAQVSGVASLIKGKDDSLTNVQIGRHLQETADDLGAKFHDQYFGAGRLNMGVALKNKVSKIHDIAITDIQIMPADFKLGDESSIIVRVRNLGNFKEKNISVSLLINGQEVTDCVPDISIDAGMSQDFTFPLNLAPLFASTFSIRAAVKPVRHETIRENNVLKKTFQIVEQDGIVTIQHKSEPYAQTHQFLAGQGWELLRRYIKGKARTITLVDKIRAGTEYHWDISQDGSILYNQEDWDSTKANFNELNKSLADSIWENDDMVDEFDKYIGDPIVYKVGHYLDLDNLQNIGNVLFPFWSNRGSNEIPGFEYEGEEEGAYSVTYRGNINPRYAYLLRSVPYSIYYHKAQMVGNADQDYKTFFEDLTGEDWPGSLASGYPLTSEDSYEYRNGFWGELWNTSDYGQVSDIDIGNDDIIEGTHEMDTYDTSETHSHYDGGADEASNFYHHFWNVNNSDNFNFDDGLFSGSSSITVAEKLWSHAIDYYNDNNKDKAYYYLGRILHLLEDMGCIPHVLNDPHSAYVGGLDAFEDFWALTSYYEGATSFVGTEKVAGAEFIYQDEGFQSPNYLRYTADTRKATLITENFSQSKDTDELTANDFIWNQQLKIVDYKELESTSLSNRAYKEFYDTLRGENNNPAVIPTVWKEQSPLFRLFYSLAEITDDFPSNDYDGDLINEDNKPLEGKYQEIYDYFAPVIQPANIEHIAGLYKLFWDTTHPVAVSVDGEPIQDGGTITKQLGDTIQLSVLGKTGIGIDKVKLKVGIPYPYADYEDTIGPFNSDDTPSISYNLDTASLSAGYYWVSVETTTQSYSLPTFSFLIEVEDTIIIEPDNPILKLNRNELNFRTIQGESPDPQYIYISNSGSGYFNWSAVSDSSIVNLSREQGSANESIEITVDSDNLNANPSIHSEITITAAGADDSPQTVDVYLTVTPPLQEGTYIPIADTYVGGIGGYNNNFGDENILNVGGVEVSGVCCSPMGSLIKFDSSAYSNKNILKATLRLFVGWVFSDVPQNIVVSLKDGDWDEMAITSQDEGWDAAHGGTVTTSVNSINWKEWDVTSLVEDWQSGRYPNHGFIVYPKTLQNGYFEFISNDDLGNATFRPQLVIEECTGNANITISDIQPDNGLTIQPFKVGQNVDWHVTITNLNDGCEPSYDLEYYLGNSSSDYSNEPETDDGENLVGYESVTEHEQLIFIESDVGTKYLNVRLYDSNNNIVDSGYYGPFEVELQPILSVFPETTLTFHTNAGSNTPEYQEVTINNDGNGTLNWSATPDTDRISIFPSGDAAPSIPRVSIIDSSGLLAGTYHYQIEITAPGAQNSPVTVPVDLVIQESGVLSITPSTSFMTTGEQGGPFDPTFKVYTLENIGTGSIDWEVSAWHDFVTLSNSFGTLLPGESTTVEVSLNTNAEALTPSIYGTFVVFTNKTNNKGNTTRAIDLTVSPDTDPPIIDKVSDVSISMGAIYTGPTPILLQGTLPVSWELVEGPIGMVINPNTGVVTWADPTGSGSPYNVTISANNSAGSDEVTWKLSVLYNSQDIDVEYMGADFSIKDESGNLLGQGTLGTLSSPYSPDNDYFIVDHAVGNLDDDADLEVVFIARHTLSYPGQVYAVDLDGTGISRYWNPGHLYTLVLHDMNTDGVEEILIGGTNQDAAVGVNTPCVFNLNAMTMTGEAPPRNGSIGTGTEIWYSTFETSVDAGIQYLEIAGDELICNTAADQSGIEYRLDLGTGSSIYRKITVGNDPITGEISIGGEEDWYIVNITEENTYLIETIEGIDTYIYLYGPDSTETLITENDDSGYDFSSRIKETLSPGTYYIKVRAFSDTQTGTYKIYTFPNVKVGNEPFTAAISTPGEIDWYSFTVESEGTFRIETPLETLEDSHITLFGPDNVNVQISVDDDSGPGLASMLETTLSPGTYYVKVRAYSDTQTGSYKFFVFPHDDSGSPPLTDEITTFGDLNWHSFTVVTEGTYRIETFLNTLFDSYIYLYGPDRADLLVAENDDGDLGYASMIETSLSPGTYYIKTRAYTSTQTGTYDLLMFPVLRVDGSSMFNNISNVGESDWYSFNLLTNDDYKIEVTLGSLKDSYIFLYGPDRADLLVEENDDDGIELGSMIETNLSTGTYYLKVRSYIASQIGSYIVSITTFDRRGDVDEDGIITLKDAVIALSVITGKNPDGLGSAYSSWGADVNGDDRLGMHEAMHILQNLASP